jgi:FMN phosphatase YigB (HAD superfamily)
MKAILFDVDGTLANCEHRVHHVQNGNRDWNKFFAEMHLESPKLDDVIFIDYIGLLR